MKQLSYIIAITFAAGLLLLAGCGGGNSTLTSGAQRTTSASLTIAWPERTRLIPLAAESIKVDVAGPHDFTATQTVDCPQTGNISMVTFPSLPVGQLTFTATAYPQANAQGVAQATATVTQTAQPYVPISINLTMGSTIATVAIAPASPTVTVNGTQQLTATAKNAAGDVVLVPATSAFTWTSSNTAKATVDANGKVTGVADGTANITATEKESGKAATVLCTVTEHTEQALISFVWRDDSNSSAGVYLMNPDGTHIRKVIDMATSEVGPPIISPDGALIAYEQDGAVNIIRLDGTVAHALNTGACGSSLCWSPDGTQLAYGGDEGIRLINTDGSNKRVLNNRGYIPSWSPDGSKIAFAYYNANSNVEVHLIDVDGTNEHAITTNPAGDIDAIAWSHNGSTIAYSFWDQSTNQLNIHLIHPDGTNAITIPSNGMESTCMVWSPQDDKLMFVEGYLRRVWVMNADGTNLHQLTLDTPFATGSLWTGSWENVQAWTTDITIN